MPYKDPKQQSAYQRERQRRVRDAWFMENGPCVDCGSEENLELDHVDPSTKESHKVWSWSKERRERELMKCVARCSTCNTKKMLWNHENPTHRLTMDAAREIRALSSQGLTNRAIAKRFDVSAVTIGKIVRNLIWREEYHMPP